MKTIMRALIPVFILALGASGWASPSRAQSLENFNKVAATADSSAESIRGVAASTVKAARNILGNPILMAIVSDEAALIRQTSTASARALRRLAKAHEALAARLRHEALQRRQQNRN